MNEPGSSVITKEDAVELANYVRLDLKKIDARFWKYGLQAELESLVVALQSGQLELKENGSLKQVAARVAFERIIRFPDYYEKLKGMDDKLIIYWRQLK